MALALSAAAVIVSFASAASAISMRKTNQQLRERIAELERENVE